MKKATILLLGLISYSAFAEEPAKQTTTQPQVDNRPMLNLFIVDRSNKVEKVIEGLKYSLKQSKQQRLCWRAVNIPFQPKNAVTEIFTSPRKSNFADPTVSVVSSKDGKKHTVTSYISTINNEYIARCWGFDNKDPIGKYTLEVNVNDIHFPPANFEIVK